MAQSAVHIPSAWNEVLKEKGYTPQERFISTTRVIMKTNSIPAEYAESSEWEYTVAPEEVYLEIWKKTDHRRKKEPHRLQLSEASVATLRTLFEELNGLSQ
jgi:hypothetical protein